ncbi:MAG: dihydroorotase [Clostridia bacterium]|nr:dihydroorotase [Clostridia bacterium]
MNFVIKNADVYVDGSFIKRDVFISGGVVSRIEENIGELDGITVITGKRLCVMPGLVDVHVHLREPGFEYKETIKTGTCACAHGGVTHVCTMPNLNPVPDNAQNLKVSLDAIKKDACVEVVPFGAITVGQKGEQISKLEEMSKDVIGFSDDGRGVQQDALMLEAMTHAKSLDKIISAHCEVNSLLNGGYIHDGEYAKKHSHRGICSQSEYEQIERDIELVKKTGVKYHVCHISAKESVEAIRRAKSEGVDITCETAPHYLVYNDMDLKEDARFKMNPPIRSESDRIALIDGVLDGTVDMIATDHAPHSVEEKTRGLEKSLMGVSGIETSFSVMYTYFVKTGVISMQHLMKLMHDNAKARFGLGTDIVTGKKADITVFDLDEKYTVKGEDFLSKGKFTPFEEKELYGKCVLTMYDGKVCYNAEESAK